MTRTAALSRGRSLCQLLFISTEPMFPSSPWMKIIVHKSMSQSLLLLTRARLPYHRSQYRAEGWQEPRGVSRLPPAPGQNQSYLPHPWQGFDDGSSFSVVFGYLSMSPWVNWFNSSNVSTVCGDGWMDGWEKACGDREEVWGGRDGV